MTLVTRIQHLNIIILCLLFSEIVHDYVDENDHILAEKFALWFDYYYRQ